MAENNTKEINLLQLINLFLNWLKKLIISTFKLLGYLTRLGFRHKLVIGISLVICLFYFLYLSRPSAQIFKAEALAVLYGNETQTAKEVCKQLENSVSSNNLYSLASKLSLPDSVAKSIIGIKSFYVIDYLKDGVADMVDYKNSHSLTDTMSIRMKDRFYLQVKTNNLKLLPTIQAAILNYFNNNTVMKRQFLLRKEELKQQIRICDVELNLIDSLAKVSYFKDIDKQLKFENNKLLVGEQKKQLFYEDMLKLHDLKAYTDSKYADFKNPIDFPSGLVVYAAPENGRLKYSLFGILTGLFIGLILSSLIESYVKIISFLNKK